MKTPTTHKCIKRLNVSLLSATCLLLVLVSSGCVNLKNNTITGTKQIPQQAPKRVSTLTPPETSTVSKTPVNYQGLYNLNRQVGNTANPKMTTVVLVPTTSTTRTLLGPNGTRTIKINYTDSTAPLDPPLARDPVMKKILAASSSVITNGTTEPLGRISVFEFKRFTERLTRSVTRLHADPETTKALITHYKTVNANSANEVQARLDILLAAYCKAYLKGEYVDRRGNVISQPEIAVKIANDTITGFETVLLEAIYDYATMTPVIYSEESKKPTFALVYPNFYQKISQNPAEFGISIAEYEAMQFLTGLSSEQSKHLSSVIMRSFGGASASFVLGANFSFGDNDTFSKLVATLCEEFARRTTDTILYEFFARFKYHVKDGNFDISKEEEDSNLELLGLDKTASKTIADLLQYQDYLAKLVKPK